MLASIDQNICFSWTAKTQLLSTILLLPSLIYRISISVNPLPSSQTPKQWHILNLSLTFILYTIEKHEYSKHYEKIRTQVFYRQGNRWKIEKKLESTISIQWKTGSEEYSCVSVIKGALEEWTLKSRELLNTKELSLHMSECALYLVGNGKGQSLELVSHIYIYEIYIYNIILILYNINISNIYLYYIILYI